MKFFTGSLPAAAAQVSSVVSHSKMLLPSNCCGVSATESPGFEQPPWKVWNSPTQ